MASSQVHLRHENLEEEEAELGLEVPFAVGPELRVGAAVCG